VKDKVRIIDGTPVPYSFEDLRRDSPKMQFPKNPSDQLLAIYDVYRMTADPEPVYDRKTQRVEPGEIEAQGDGFVQRWRVVNLSTEEVEQRAIDRRAKMRVDLYQLRLALIDGGHDQAVRTEIQALTPKQRERLQILMESKPSVNRQERWINTLLSGAGLTDEQVDGIFEAAAGITE